MLEMLVEDPFQVPILMGVNEDKQARAPETQDEMPQNLKK